MRRVLLTASIALLALAPRAPAGGLTAALSAHRTPVSARADTVWTWPSGGATLAPLAIGAHPSGVITVIERSRHRLFLTDSLGTNVRFTSRADPGTGLGFASRVFAASGLQIWTLDTWNARLERFDLAGRSEAVIDLAARAGEVGYEIGELVDFCLDPTGDLFALDARRGRILHFDRRGYLRATIGETGEISLAAPVAIDADGRGRLFVLESRPPSLLVLDTDGRLIRRSLTACADSARTQEQPSSGLDCRSPSSLAVDSWGNAYVGDGRESAVLVVPDHGQAWWLQLPANAGAPADLALCDARRLLAADPEHACVWVMWIDYRRASDESVGSGSQEGNAHGR